MIVPEDFGRERKPNSRRALMSKIDQVALPPSPGVRSAAWQAIKIDRRVPSVTIANIG